MTLTFGMSIDRAILYAKGDKAEILNSFNLREKNLGQNSIIEGQELKKTFNKLTSGFETQKGVEIIEGALKQMPKEDLVVLNEISKLNELGAKASTKEELQKLLKLKSTEIPNINTLLNSGVIPGQKDLKRPTDSIILKEMNITELKSLTKMFLHYFKVEEFSQKFTNALIESVSHLKK